MCDLAREAGQGGAGTWWVGERMHLAVSSLCLPRGTSTTATPASPGVDAHAIGVCIHVWAPSGACSTGVWNGYVNRLLYEKLQLPRLHIGLRKPQTLQGGVVCEEISIQEALVLGLPLEHVVV